MPPRLAYIVHSLNPGGTEKLAKEMAKAFSPEFEVMMICLDELGAWANELRESNIPVYCLYRQPGFDLRLIWKLALFLRKNKLELVHAHQTTPWFYAGLAKFIYPNFKLLFEEHGRFYPERKKQVRILFNRFFLVPVTNAITAVSQDIKSRLVKYEGIPENKIEVIYNGIFLPEIDKEARNKIRVNFGFKEEDFVVGCICRFDSIKNLPMLVKAIAIARRKNKHIKGIIVGDGPCFQEINALIKTLHLQKEIILPGYYSKASVLLPAFDLFVLPSFSEGISVALLEAMAAGVPVVATSVGGNVEIIEHEKNGWLVPSGDVSKLAELLLKAVHDKEKCEILGQEGQKTVEEKFLFSKMINQYRLIYSQLLE